MAHVVESLSSKHVGPEFKTPEPLIPSPPNNKNKSPKKHNLEKHCNVKLLNYWFPYAVFKMPKLAQNTLGLFFFSGPSFWCLTTVLQEACPYRTDAQEVISLEVAPVIPWWEVLSCLNQRNKPLHRILWSPWRGWRSNLVVCLFPACAVINPVINDNAFHLLACYLLGVFYIVC
jgi:hypothetical protein